MIKLLILVVVLVIIAGAIASHSAGRWEADRDGPPAGFWWGPLWLLVIAGIIFVIVRKISRTVAPLADVMDAAGRVAEGDYDVRVTPGGSPDVQGVVRAFNTMTMRLAANEEQRKHLLSDIAHELRTPLAVVQGTIEGMIDGVYEPDAATLSPLLDQTKVISRLLNDLQVMATTEAGMLALHRTPTDLVDLLRDVARGFGPAAREHGVALGTNAPEPVVADVDPVRLRQVLDNLVTNALRYTPADGAVVLGLRRVADMAEITVRDTGRGMPPEDAARIFERFVKSADSGGSGLGLAIARGLVEAHGGTIAAESAPGAGTTITIHLPLHHEP